MSFFTEVKNTIHSTYVNNVSKFINPTGPSKFAEDGTLTPEEFLAAGELLTFKCPTWKFESGDASKSVNYLPADKQFLVTYKVPCEKRVKDLVAEAKSIKYKSAEIADDDGWVISITPDDAGGDDEVLDMEVPELDGQKLPKPVQKLEEEDDDDIPDMDGFEEDNLEDDPAAVSSRFNNEIIRQRSYDIHITYDRYYRTPRVWLFGYDEDGKPLPPERIFEDISQDHAHKTVTIDKHPHLGIPFAYIHPCKHAAVMKKICDKLAENGKELRVDQYLFLFLKFISTVIPTINYDFTISMDGR